MGVLYTPVRAPSSTLFLLVFLSQLLLAVSLPTNRTTPVVPAFIVFGDSIVDPGNNNVLETLSRSDHPPYGQDFPGQVATGRFSNGKIPSDFIASKLGIKEYLPAYLGTDLSPEDILTGVSFASAASGYDPLTPLLTSALSMSDQLELFKEYKNIVIAIAGEERAEAILSQALYATCTGTDDIANTYFTTPFRITHYDIPSYVNFLVNSASSFLEDLIGLGAKKIAFVGLPPVGCVPSQRTLGGGILRVCEPMRNQAASLFNSQMSSALETIMSRHQGIRIVLLDIYEPLLDIINNPLNYGFIESSKGCCGTGTVEVTFLCNSYTSTVCEDDTKYVFWDSYHPTERAYDILTDKLIERYIQYLA